MKLGQWTARCQICNSRFNDGLDLSSHRCVPAKHQCEQCGKGFPKKQQLMSHMVSHSDERPFGCIYCLEEFKKPHHAKRHVRSVHGIEPPDTMRIADIPHWNELSRLRNNAPDPVAAYDRVRCPYCCNTLVSEAELRQHIGLYHKRELEDDYSTSAEGDMGVDYRVCEWTVEDSENATFICQVCLRVFSHRHLLASHTRAHTGKHFICPYCDQRFELQTVARSHIQGRHSMDMRREAQRQSISNPELFACPACDLEFAGKDECQQHISACLGSVSPQVSLKFPSI